MFLTGLCIPANTLLWPSPKSVTDATRSLSFTLIINNLTNSKCMQNSNVESVHNCISRHLMMVRHTSSTGKKTKKD